MKRKLFLKKIPLKAWNGYYNITHKTTEHRVDYARLGAVV